MVSKSAYGIRGQMLAGHMVFYWFTSIYSLLDTVDISGFPPQRSKCINGVEKSHVIHSLLRLNL